MRIAIIVLTLAAAALAVPVDPAEPVVDPEAPPPVRVLEGGEKQDGVSKLDAPPALEGTDDLKPDETFWGGFGWGYRPYYRTYYWRPRYYYSQPYYGRSYYGGWGKWGYGWGGW